MIRRVTGALLRDWLAMKGMASHWMSLAMLGIFMLGVSVLLGVMIFTRKVLA